MAYPLSGCAAILVTLSMQELSPDHSGGSVGIIDPFKQTLQTGYWILANPLVLIVIAAGVLFDQPIRQLLVVSSQLYARIEIPVLYFGIISAGTAVIGLLAATPMRRLATSQSPRANLFCSFVPLRSGFSVLHCLSHGGVLGFLCSSRYPCDSSCFCRATT